MPILKVKSRQIFDSRGLPTLEVDLITEIGLLRSSIPSCIHENVNAAYEKRSEAVDIVTNILAPEILKSKLDVCPQKEFDEFLVRLDGTDNKSKLGSVAISGTSIACCKAGAAKRGLPLYRYIAQIAENGSMCLPVPAFNVIAGGITANNNLAFEGFSLLPTGAANYTDALKMALEVYQEVERNLAEKEETKLPLPTNAVGAFVPQTLEDDKEALSIIDESIKRAGFDGKVKISLDISASEFCKDGMYDLLYKTEDSDPDDYLDAEMLKEHYVQMLAEFPCLVSFKDPFDKDDWEGWSMLRDTGVFIIADDLTAMNVDLIQEVIDRGIANCLTLHAPQFGSVSEVIVCAKMVRLAGWGLSVTSGFGSTGDQFAADLCVGLSCGIFKAGAPDSSSYNQLMRIEEEMGKNARYAGEHFRNPLMQ